MAVEMMSNTRSYISEAAFGEEAVKGARMQNFR